MARFGVRSGLRQARAMQSSALRSPQANRVFQAIGTPSIRGLRGGRNISAEKQINSGRRRAAVIGSALAANAMLGPRGSQGSSGGRGYTQPRSTGGYA